jgi:hypothetical protein
MRCFLAAAFAGVLAACGSVGEPPSGSSHSPASAAQPASDRAAADAPSLASTEAESLRKQVDAALADAAGRTGGEMTSLSVVSAEAVVWPDGSLGCPVPGVVYTMAPVAGYRIRIQSGDRLLVYHAGRRGNPVPCPAGRSTDPRPGATM